MDYIVPIVVVVYLVATVIDAVQKRSRSERGADPRPDWTRVSRPQQLEPSEMDIAAENEPELVTAIPRSKSTASVDVRPGEDTVADSEPEFDDAQWEAVAAGGDVETTSKEAVAGKGKLSLDRASIVQGFIIGELLRERRGQRPWPRR